MCDTIYLVAEEREIQTPRQLTALVGPALCPPDVQDPAADDCCLCNTDVEPILTAAGYSWRYENGWYLAAKETPTDAPTTPQ